MNGLWQPRHTEQETARTKQLICPTTDSLPHRSRHRSYTRTPLQSWHFPAPGTGCADLSSELSQAASSPSSDPDPNFVYPPRVRKKIGRPVGSKNSFRRKGRPSPMKGISKYANLAKPPNVSTVVLNSSGARRQQGFVKIYQINHTNAGVPAVRPCRRCFEKSLPCRFFRRHKNGSTCGNCEQGQHRCDFGLRAKDQLEGPYEPMPEPAPVSEAVSVRETPGRWPTLESFDRTRWRSKSFSKDRSPRLALDSELLMAPDPASPNELLSEREPESSYETREEMDEGVDFTMSDPEEFEQQPVAVQASSPEMAPEDNTPLERGPSPGPGPEPDLDTDDDVFFDALS